MSRTPSFDPVARPRAGAALPMIIAATSFAFLLVQLDVSIVNVALPAMGRGLQAQIDGLEWIVDAYTLAFAALLLFAGTLGDRIGSRPVFLAGFALFIAASASCGLATGLAMLIASRVVQGAGAALMVPTSLALLNRACAGDAATRARAIGLWTAAGSVGLALGPILGGMLVDGSSWRSVFLVNLPLGLAGILLTLRYVEDTPRRAGGYDPAGQILGILALVGLVGGTIEAGPHGWLSPIPLSGIVLGLVALGLFVMMERRSRDPMLPLGFFRDRRFSTAVVTGFAVNLAIYGILFVLSLYLQHERGFSPTQAGRAFLPFAFVLGLANVAAGRLAGRTGTRVLMIAGLGIGIAGFLMLCAVSGAHADLALQGGLVATALGIGTAVPAMTSTLLSSVPSERSGVASGVLNTVRQGAGALGVAVFGTLLAADVHAGLRAALLISAGLLGAAAAMVAVAGRAPRTA